MKTIEELLQEATQKIQDVKDSSSLNDLRVLYLGKKGPVQELMKGMKDLSKEEKPIFGQKVNQLKQDLSKMIEEKKEQLAALEMQKKIESEKIDITLPGRRIRKCAPIKFGTPRIGRFIHWFRLPSY